MFNLKTNLTPELLLQSIYETLYMVALSLPIGTVIGLGLGIVLFITKPNGVSENNKIFKPLNIFINIIRSIPALILLVQVIPIASYLGAPKLGSQAMIIPLIFFVSPYIARLVENSLLEINSGILEAANAMGATTWQVVWHFLLPEARSSLILCITTATIGLVGATTIAGTVGGGGLGDLAISYGYQRFDAIIMATTIVILVIIVQSIQSIGNKISKSIRDKYRRN